MRGRPGSYAKPFATSSRRPIVRHVRSLQSNSRARKSTKSCGKRLFKKLPPKSVIDSVATAYAGALFEAVKSKSVAKSAEQIADEIHAAYPFHPSVKHVIAMFKENESYRRTRGLMQFVSKMIKSAWMRPVNNTYLIGCQHLNLNLMDVREEINKISNLQGAIAHDVASAGTAVAETVDAHNQNDAATQCAALLVIGSLSESVDAVKGFSKAQMLEYLIAPTRTANEFQDAFEALKADAWYLHRKENDAYYFSNVENLRKRIENRANGAPQPKVDQEMRRRLEAIFRPDNGIAYQSVHALPKIDEIRLNGPRVCLVLSPDSKIPPAEAQEFWKSVTEKNNFCVVTGDGSNLGNLEDKTRRTTHPPDGQAGSRGLLMDLNPMPLLSPQTTCRADARVRAGRPPGRPPQPALNRASLIRLARSRWKTICYHRPHQTISHPCRPSNGAVCFSWSVEPSTARFDVQRVTLNE